TMAAIVEHDPRPLSEIVNDVPPDLDALVSQCLQKEPGKRPQTAQEVAAALRKMPTDSQRVMRLRVPRRLLSVLWAAAALALLIVGGMYWFHGRSQAADSIAVLPFVNSSGNADMEYLSDGITESLINALSRIPNLAVMSRNSVFQYKGRQSDAQAA